MFLFTVIDEDITMNENEKRIPLRLSHINKLKVSGVLLVSMIRKYTTTHPELMVTIEKESDIDDLIVIEDETSNTLTLGTKNRNGVVSQMNFGGNNIHVIGVNTGIIAGGDIITDKGKISISENSIAPIVVQLYVHELPKLRAKDCVDIKTGIFDQQSLNIKAKGCADVAVIGCFHQVKINVSGQADIYLKGDEKQHCDCLTLNCSGQADFNGRDFVANHAVVDASGQSDVKVHAKDSISASASGMSDIVIYGKPPKRSVTKTGMADVEFKSKKKNN